MSIQLGSAIKLEDAYFCLNCEVITNYLDICPVCGERQLWALQNWLGRVNGLENSRYKKSALPEFRPARTAEVPKTHSGDSGGMIHRSLLTWRKKLLCAG